MKQRIFNFFKGNIKLTIIVILILLVPIVLFYLDNINFSTGYKLTEKYDWLSFLGSYIGSIISAAVLIYITREDRNKNTELQFDLNRPNLDINFEDIEPHKIIKHINMNRHHCIVTDGSNLDYNQKKNEIISSKHNISVCTIRNIGESLAIINAKDIYIKFNYINSSNKSEQITAIIPTNRVKLSKNDELFVILSSDVWYKHSKIIISDYSLKYFDLGNRKYLCDHDNDNIIIK